MNRIAVFALALLCSLPSLADDYPTKPIRLIVPSAAGGSVDRLARGIGRRLSERLGQPVVVDNRGGAGGTIATEQTATAKPDGYTILIGTIAGLATNVSLEKLRYDPLKDLAPITLVGTQDYVLLVNPAVPASSVKELIALAKAKPKGLSYASAGKGTGSHLSGELLSQLAGIELIHVAYKGMSPALTDVIGGQVSFTFASVASALPMISAKRLKPIAVTGKKRSPLLPQVPTMIEAGVPGYESSTWYGIVAPAATPQPVVDKLYKETVATLKEPEVRKIFSEEGIEIVASTPQEFKTFMANEIDKWRAVISHASMQAN
jgi:tripartite-type tricarboxylate transporter receptor subunit TctC